MTTFSTERGRRLAEELAIYIATEEPIQNRDECLDEITELVYKLTDDKLGAPVSALINAEVMNKLKKRAKDKRYKVQVRETV